MEPNELLSFDFDTLPGGDRYRLMIGAVVPRPIAFVSTINAEGAGNLAPFSFFNAISSSPPCLAFSITRKRGGEKKDTLRNIEATRQFVVNTVSEWMTQPMHQSSADYPYGVDEMSKVGLTPLPSVKVRPARVAEAAVQMECVLDQIVSIGDGGPGSAELVIGRIVMVHVRKDIYVGGEIDTHALKPVARLGGAGYAVIGKTFEHDRPSF